MKTYSKQISDTAREVFSTDSIPKIHKDSEFYKKPRTKVEFVKVKSAFELDRAVMNQGNYGWKSDSGEFYPSFNEVEIIGNLTRDSLYRRIETPMTEREAFIEGYKDLMNSDDSMTVGDWAGVVFDKLVN